MSKELMRPWQMLSARICQTWTWCEKASAARAKDWTIDAIWVTDEDAVLVPAVDPDAGEGGEDEGRELAGESSDAEQPGGVGEAEDEPRGGEARHPGADDGDALAEKEEPEISMGERTERHRESSGHT